MLLKAHLLFISCLLSISTVYASGNHEGAHIPFRLANGQLLFNKNCSSCHGQNLLGSETGPPLLHPFYKPSHHGDSSFYRAGLKGVKAHHWQFGDMPPVEGMNEQKMKSIISFIRFYQQQKKLY